MKRCPQCHRTETDDALVFCRADGAALVSDSSSLGSEAGTATLGTASASTEIETSILPHRTDADMGRPTAPTTVLPAQSTPGATRELRKPKRRWPIVAASALILIAIVTAVYFYVTRKSSAAINSIAVMPFVNDSGNADLEYLSDGMTETLINSLSQLPKLSVKARSLVFRYKGKELDLKKIAAELNVQVIVTGRVVQRGDQMTLNLELIDAQTGNMLWGNRYERKSSELVALQSEVAKDVSTNLKNKLSGADETKVTKAATTDPEAYQAYLKGRYYWNRRTAENIRKAIEQFKSATDRDPNYALAFVGLADCYVVLPDYAGTRSSETIPQARSYAERALSLDPQLAEARATLGTLNRQSWQWAESEKEYKRAIEINPNYATTYHWYSILLRDLRRNDEAMAMIMRAHELDPLSSVISANVSEMYQAQNNHDASIEISLKTIELDSNFPTAYEDLGISYVIKGRNAEAIVAEEKAAELSKRAGVTLGSMGYVYAVAGKRAEAVAVIKELEDKYARKEAIGFDVAAVYAGLGEKDKAFEWLEKDFQTRDARLARIRWQTQFESLRDDPRLKDLLKRMNLPE